MKKLLIGILALSSISAFADITVLTTENLYSDLKISLDKVGAATQEMTLKSDFQYSLGLNGHQFKDAFNDYKRTVEEKLGYECLPQAGTRTYAPMGGTVEKIIKNTQKLCLKD